MSGYIRNVCFIIGGFCTFKFVQATNTIIGTGREAREKAEKENRKLLHELRQAKYDNEYLISRNNRLLEQISDRTSVWKHDQTDPDDGTNYISSRIED